MEHNLDDSLNLEGSIESMDFDNAGVVVSQDNMTLSANEHSGDLSMDFEEQQILMDAGTEEVIGDQFSLQEYAVQDDQTPEPEVTIELNSASLKPTKKPEVSSMPRQVPIAPKPRLSQTTKPKTTFGPGKQYAIAPKPVTFVMNKNTKKVSVAGVQTNSKGNAVLAQIGKQLVMVPAEGAQKIKLVSAGSGATLQYVRANSDQAQLTPAKAAGTTQAKPLVAKVVVQAGHSNTDTSNQPAVLTKLLPSSNAGARYVMQQKTVPISIGNKVLLSSPTKQGVKKQQIIAVKSSPQKGSTKKVFISANPNQNVILKTTAPSKTGQITKDGNVILQGGQRTQLHQINVPGKGIQYIRLVTNSTPAASKSSSSVTLPAKSFVLTDAKGTVLQMSSEKMLSTQPPPLIITGNLQNSSKVTVKPDRKLVRIAPLTSKSGAAATQPPPARPPQSLLAPLSPALVKREPEPRDHDPDDVKPALRDHVQPDTLEGQIMGENADSMDNSTGNNVEHPLIVIPNFQHEEYDDREIVYEQDIKTSINMHESKTLVELEPEIVYSPPKTSPSPDNDVGATELGLRPRKACNCTKSQCLKLYCDCFANGEFCNQCNCNNCHNNLENEALRQKAIRACLERNPNAFRPKIGKAKIGGPDIIRRHNKGCNCKRSGCLKNYCECYEAKIACTAMCKCVGCRNVQELVERRRDMRLRTQDSDSTFRPALLGQPKNPCTFMTMEVIEAVCQCLVAAAVERRDDSPRDASRDSPRDAPRDALGDVLEEFARCLHEIIGASHHDSLLLDVGQT
ncbi:protein lin-54 homolog isoform X2 [Bombyx mandarina]|uniref:Protein lin-54 homolog isoform X2 n=1 Tax=Bombyx mandarina TaxID=7092 RepID=A0A6J2JJX4_BOMMA|nr:protein lin-54 homolog isoform X2 [Bombyx mandarina]